MSTFLKVGALSLLMGLSVPGAILATTGPGSEEYDKGVKAFSTKDYGLALTCWEKSEAQGNITALGCIGTLYNQGLGVPQDTKTGMNFYLQAANKGNSDAQNFVGLAYESGPDFLPGCAKDYKQAMKWLKKSSAQGNSNAEWVIGTMYENGEGVKVDKQSAFTWYQKSAGKGNKFGEYHLGKWYTDKFVENDSQETYDLADQWLEKSDAQGCKDATLALDALGSMISPKQAKELSDGLQNK